MFTIAVKHFILDVCGSSEYSPRKLNKKYMIIYQYCGPATLLRINWLTGLLLYILQNFWETYFAGICNVSLNIFFNFLLQVFNWKKQKQKKTKNGFIYFQIFDRFLSMKHMQSDKNIHIGRKNKCSCTNKSQFLILT